MLRHNILRASKPLSALRSSVRHNSSSSKVSNIANTANTLVQKSVFWAKVVGELAKQVYIKEGMAPPTSAQVKSVYELLQAQACSVVKNPQAAFETVKANAVPYAVKFGVGAVQVFGLFSLGEIIGRRKVVGYAHH